MKVVGLIFRCFAMRLMSFFVKVGLFVLQQLAQVRQLMLAMAVLCAFSNFSSSSWSLMLRRDFIFLV